MRPHGTSSIERHPSPHTQRTTTIVHMTNNKIELKTVCMKELWIPNTNTRYIIFFRFFLFVDEVEEDQKKKNTSHASIAYGGLMAFCVSDAHNSLFRCLYSVMLFFFFYIPFYTFYVVLQFHVAGVSFNSLGDFVAEVLMLLEKKVKKKNKNCRVCSVHAVWIYMVAFHHFLPDLCCCWRVANWMRSMDDEVACIQCILTMVFDIKSAQLPKSFCNSTAWKIDMKFHWNDTLN